MHFESLGVKIVTGYQDDLYEFYQKFDLYAFPVKRSDAAISMPLSIIEALLSNIISFFLLKIICQIAKI